ncbi:serine/threonine-protein kinase akt-2-like [Xenopus tropicalis]|uniref:Serine/threonine-protein kinase akt-2-like n=1 Tax=Xenopus tropicalis TaxID=8364 RepID=A0A8J1J1U0_XENTR|nr:serine/threonine-protein kinase akt-2-like [Xenopus tropicalis]
MEEFPDSFTPETCGILKGLFDTRTRMRLGASGSGAEEVKKSSFFMNLDWEALSRKEVKPPKNNRVNTHKFLFTTEPASTLDSPEEPLSVEIQKAVQDVYKNLK